MPITLKTNGGKVDLTTHTIVQKADLTNYYTKNETDAAIDVAIEAIPEPDLSGYALKTDIPSLDGYAKTSDIPDVSGFITEVPAEYVTDTELEGKGYLTEHQQLKTINNQSIVGEGNIAIAGGGEPDAYIKSAAVNGNKLTLTNKDDTTVEFEPAGGGGGGSSYTFTNGLTETDGTVKSDLYGCLRLGETTNGYSLTFDADGYNNTNIKATKRGSIALGAKHFGSSGAIKATGEGSFCWGAPHGGGTIEASGAKSMALVGSWYGLGDAYASGACSKNLGYLSSPWFTYASGTGSIVLGTASSRNVKAKGSGSIITGSDCMANGDYSIASGKYTTTTHAFQNTRGSYNALDESTETSSNKGTYIEIVGNGTARDALSNAYTLDWSGNATFAGTVSSAGADYAEFFEWKDGNIESEDRVGYIVTLDGDKIKYANDGDDILGIISGTAMVLGDNAEWNWRGRFLTDDFGRIIYEDYDVEHEAVIDKETGDVIEEEWTEHIHAPVTNPAYNPSQPYINRRNRPEWGTVGIMGKLYVRDDGTAQVNGYVTAKNGIATASETRTNMRVMERVSDNIIRVLLK